MCIGKLTSAFISGSLLKNSQLGFESVSHVKHFIDNPMEVDFYRQDELFS